MFLLSDSVSCSTVGNANMPDFIYIVYYCKLHRTFWTTVSFSPSYASLTSALFSKFPPSTVLKQFKMQAVSCFWQFHCRQIVELSEPRHVKKSCSVQRTWPGVAGLQSSPRQSSVSSHAILVHVKKTREFVPGLYFHLNSASFDW